MAIQQPPETEIERLYREHHHAVLGFARSRVGHAGADDVASEVWRRAERHLRLRPDTPISRGWLTTVARNIVIDGFRRELRWQRRLEVIRRDAESVVDSETSEAADRIGEALGQIEPHHRCVLLLHYVEGLTAADIANRYDRSPRAIESLVRRAKAKLAEAYAGVQM